MAIQGLPEEPELVRALDARHLPYLGEFDMRLLAASEFGYSVETMVVAFSRSEATIRRHLAELKHSDGSAPLLLGLRGGDRPCGEHPPVSRQVTSDRWD